MIHAAEAGVSERLRKRSLQGTEELGRKGLLQQGEDKEIGEADKQPRQ